MVNGDVKVSTVDKDVLFGLDFSVPGGFGSQGVSLIRVFSLMFLPFGERFVRMLVGGNEYDWFAAARNKRIPDSFWDSCVDRLSDSDLESHHKSVRLAILLNNKKLSGETLWQVFNSPARYLLLLSLQARSFVDFMWANRDIFSEEDFHVFVCTLLGVMVSEHKGRLVFGDADLLNVLKHSYSGFGEMVGRKKYSDLDLSEYDVKLASGRLEVLLKEQFKSQELSDGVLLEAVGCDGFDISFRKKLFKKVWDRNLNGVQEFPIHWGERMFGIVEE